MTTVIPPAGVEPPYPPDLEPRRAYDDTPPSSPGYRRRSGAALWIPVVLGALVVLGLLYWLALPKVGWNTAANTTTITVGPKETSPPAAQPSGSTANP